MDSIELAKHNIFLTRQYFDNKYKEYLALYPTAPVPRERFEVQKSFMDFLHCCIDNIKYIHYYGPAIHKEIFYSTKEKIWIAHNREYSINIKYCNNGLRCHK